jgi:hypothetical protein
VALYRRSDHKQMFSLVVSAPIPRHNSTCPTITASTRNEFVILEDGKLALYFVVYLWVGGFCPLPQNRATCVKSKLSGRYLQEIHTHLATSNSLTSLQRTNDRETDQRRDSIGNLQNT